MTPRSRSSSTRNTWAIVGAINGALAVALGAFGAHGLETMVENGQLSPEMLATFETAVRYQMYHALALVALGALARSDNGAGKLAGCAFLAGIVIFSGMLYAYVLTGIKVFAMIVPIGGVAFIVGWVALAVALWRECRECIPMKDDSDATLVWLEQNLRDVADSVSIRGDGPGSFIYATKGSRAVEASLNDGDIWVEYWSSPADDAAPDRESTFPTKEAALSSIVEWLSVSES